MRQSERMPRCKGLVPISSHFSMRGIGALALCNFPPEEAVEVAPTGIVLEGATIHYVDVMSTFVSSVYKEL